MAIRSSRPGISTLERALDTALSGRDAPDRRGGHGPALVDGMETNPEFEPLRDLRRPVARGGDRGLEFRPGVAAPELLAVFGALASHSDGRPRGRWCPTSRSARSAPPLPAEAEAWLSLERLVLRGAGPRGRDRAIRTSSRSPSRCSPPSRRGIRGYSRLLSAAGAAPAPRPPEERALLSRLLRRLPLAVLRRLLAPQLRIARPGQLPARGRARQLPAPVLLRLLEAAAQGRESELSPAALQVLARMARRGTDPEQRATRRALAGELARLAPMEPEIDLAAQFPRIAPEPERVLKLALESGILEPGTLAAADRMIARRQVAPLLALLETVPEKDPIARALTRPGASSRGPCERVLEGSPVDLEVARPAGSRGRHRRGAGAARRARGIPGPPGPAARCSICWPATAARSDPLAAERMDGMPWYVQRNLLALLGRLPDRPMRYTPPGMLAHRDPRVRHEALALAIADAATAQPRTRRGVGERVRADPAARVPDPRRSTARRSSSPGSSPGRRIRRSTRTCGRAAIAALAPVNDPVVLRVLRRLVGGPRHHRPRAARAQEPPDAGRAARARRPLAQPPQGGPAARGGQAVARSGDPRRRPRAFAPHLSLASRGPSADVAPLPACSAPWATPWKCATAGLATWRCAGRPTAPALPRSPATCSAGGGPDFHFSTDGVEYGPLPLAEFEGWLWARRLARGVSNGSRSAGDPDPAAVAAFLDFAAGLLPDGEIAVMLAPDGLRWGRHDSSREPEADSAYPLTDELNVMRHVFAAAARGEHLPLGDVHAVATSLGSLVYEEQIQRPAAAARGGPRGLPAGARAQLRPAVAGRWPTRWAWRPKSDGSAGWRRCCTTSAWRACPPGRCWASDSRPRIAPGSAATRSKGRGCCSGMAEGLEAAAVVCYEHHLRVDGGGYPRLSYPREPHVLSRVVAVCDAFDALLVAPPRPALLRPRQRAARAGAKRSDAIRSSDRLRLQRRHDALSPGRGPGLDNATRLVVFGWSAGAQALHPASSGEPR